MKSTVKEFTMREAIAHIQASDDHTVSLELYMGEGRAWFDVDVDFLVLLGMTQLDKVIHYNFDDKRHLVCLLEAEGEARLKPLN